MRGWIGRRCMGKRKAVYWILLALIVVTVTGCGYTLEEKKIGRASCRERV